MSEKYSITGPAIEEAMTTLPEDIPFLVEDLVTEKAVLQFYGDGGVGKSTISRCAAMSMAAGVPVWNRYRCVRPLRVFYLVAEGDAREAIIHLRRMRQEIPLNIDNLFICDVFAGTMNVLDDTHVNKLISAIAQDTEDKVDVIFLDPIYPLVPGGLSEDRTNAGFARFIINLRKRFNCAVWMNHHTTRNQLTMKGEETKRAKNYYGSVWLRNALTAQYSVEELEHGRHLHCEKDRFSLLDPNITLDYKTDTDTLNWREQPMDATKRDKMRKYIIGQIGAEEPFTFSDMVREIGRVSRREFSAVCNELEMGTRRTLMGKAENKVVVTRVSDFGYEGSYQATRGE